MNDQMLAKYRKRDLKTAEEAEAEAATELSPELKEDLVLQTGETQLTKENLIDVPYGPMRQLKRAPSFDVRATGLISEPGSTAKQFQELSKPSHRP